MYKWIPIVFLSLATTISFAQTAYVAAPSGLKLRKTASPTGEVVKTLVYGTKVTSIADSNRQVAHKTKEAEGFYINGYWELVVAGKDTGYVFDAFLLPFEPVTLKQIEDYYDTHKVRCKPYEYTYFEKNYKKAGELFGIKNYPPADSVYVEDKKSPFCVKAFKQKFAGGNIVFDHIESGEEHDGRLLVTFTNCNFNNIYTIILNFNAIENRDLGGTLVTYKNGKIEIGPKDQEAGCYSTITRNGNTIVWKLWCGC